MDLEPEYPSASLEPALSLSEPTSEPPANRLPKVYRDRVQGARQLRKAAVAGIVWAAMAATLAAIIGAAVIFRVDMVRLWPRTAAAYAAVGLTVNPIGLVIEQVHAEPALRDGHAALAITGVIRNIEDRMITSPPLRITLLNAEGRAVGGKLAVPTNAQIPPGGTRHFSVAVLDPPGSTANLMLAFDRNASRQDIARALSEATRARAAAGPGGSGLRGHTAPAVEPPAAPIDPALSAPTVQGVPEAAPGVHDAPPAVAADPSAPTPIRGHATTTVTPLGPPVPRAASRASPAAPRPVPATPATPAAPAPSATLPPAAMTPPSQRSPAAAPPAPSAEPHSG